MYVDKCISKCIAKTTYPQEPKHFITWNGHNSNQHVAHIVHQMSSIHDKA